jgi:hypothetical protein
MAKSAEMSDQKSLDKSESNEQHVSSELMQENENVREEVFRRKAIDLTWNFVLA